MDRRGVVSFRSPPAGPTAVARSRTAAEIRTALTLADAADTETASRLAALTRLAGVDLPDSATVGAPPPGAAPAAVRRWWDGLSSAQQRWLVARSPDLVGRLDGLPVAIRDRANRLLMAERRADLLRQRARLLATPRSRWAITELRRLSRAITGVDALAARLTSATDRRAYLLALDTGGDGRAVISVGDPDHAENVLTHVPGMSSDLASSAGELGRVDRVVARCGDLDPAAATAGVMWLDYDAPDFLGEASRRDAATSAGPGLHRFLDGLRASHDGPPARQTVLGHSYGSLVVGSTARSSGLAADALVFVGSPGVGVEHAADLGLPSGRVWAATAGDDIIQHAARPPAGMVADVLHQPGPPSLRLPLGLALPGGELWFGRNPASPAFGGGIFASAPRGHSGYWDAGNPALDGMARIVLGERP